MGSSSGVFSPSGLAGDGFARFAGEARGMGGGGGKGEKFLCEAGGSRVRESFA
jgi:hypothetical protein